LSVTVNAEDFSSSACWNSVPRIVVLAPFDHVNTT